MTAGINGPGCQSPAASTNQNVTIAFRAKTQTASLTFSSQAKKSQLCVLTLIRCPFHPRATAVTRKRPRSFCQKCRWQVTSKHAYILDLSKSEWADYAAVQGTLGHSRLSSLSHFGLILA